MQKVPQIVSERLKAARPAVNHPDADVLTAFSEQTLPLRERATVLEHLSNCSDCRDILALALPETNPVETVVDSAVGGRFTWPTLRWGFVAAGIVVASFAVLQYQRQMRTSSMVAKTALPPIVKSEPQTIATRAGESKVSPQDESQINPVVSTSANEQGKVQSPVSLVVEGTSVNTTPVQASKALVKRDVAQSSGAIITTPSQANLPQGPRINQPNQAQQQNTAPARVPANAPQSYGGNPVQGTTAPAPAAPQTLALNAPNFTELQPQQSQRVDQVQDGSLDESKVGKAKPADALVVSQTAKVLKSAPARAERVIDGGSSFAPIWTISSAGGLQRSFDLGQTWQEVNVNSGSSAEVASLSARARVANAQAKQRNRDKDEFDKKTAGTPIVFRAVAVNGADVWAGGSGATLYHSFDAGVHWVRVAPASGDSMLTGDIVSVEFADSRRGKVSTSTPEIWMTDDAGQTWRKQ